VSSPLLTESHSALFNHFSAVSRVITSAAGVPLGSLHPLLGNFTCNHLYCRSPTGLSSTTFRQGTCHHLCCMSPTRLTSTTSRQFHVSSPMLQESHSALFNHFSVVSCVITPAAGVPLGYLQPLPGCFRYHQFCCRCPPRFSSTTSRHFHVS
jgi:hypothetical protein